MRYERYPTRGVHQNFVVPNRIHSYKLSPDAYVIYLYLCRSNPVRCGKLAEDLSLSPNKVEWSISELQSHRLVTVKDVRIFLREQPSKPQEKLLPDAKGNFPFGFACGCHSGVRFSDALRGP